MIQLTVNMGKFTIDRATNDSISGVYGEQGIAGTAIIFNEPNFIARWNKGEPNVVKELQACNEFIIDLAFLSPATQTFLIKKHNIGRAYLPIHLPDGDGRELDITELSPAVQTEINRKLQQIKK